jgi:hypothetical protein
MVTIIIIIIIIVGGDRLKVTQVTHGAPLLPCVLVISQRCLLSIQNRRQACHETADPAHTERSAVDGIWLVSMLLISDDQEVIAIGRRC